MGIRKKGSLALGVGLLILWGLGGPAAAFGGGREIEGAERIIDQVEFIGGYGYASINEGDYITMPLIVHLGAVGAGFYLSLTRKVALNLGYRYRHISNADIKKPNDGIDSHIGLLGLSYFF
jgi:hypothetical protein